MAEELTAKQSNVFDDLDGDGILEGAGRDYRVVNGTEKKETINSVVGDPNWINAGAGNDVINGKNAYDMLAGNEGNDKINASKANGAVEIYGGADKDTLTGSAHNDWIAGNEGNDSLKGGKGDDTLLGGDHNKGSEDGNDVIYGEDGNDVILGGLGADTITGGKGQNTIIHHTGDGNDVINLTKGENFTLKVDSFVKAEIAANKKDVLIYTSDDEYITIKNLASKDVTNDATKKKEDESSVLLQVAGQDTPIDLRNHMIEDWIPFYSVKTNKNYTGTWLDEEIYATSVTAGKNNKGVSINAGGGDDHINGSEFNDTLKGGDGDDYIWTYGGKDKVYGGNGNDYLISNAGDTLPAGTELEPSTLYGDKGNDTIETWNTGDIAYGGDGDDLINFRNNTKQTAYGGKGDDTFWITKGNATVYGEAGNDEILGGKESASDIVFAKGGGHDIYTNRGVADTLVFNKIATSALSFENSGNDLVINYGKNESVTVKNYTDDMNIYIQTKEGKVLLSDLYVANKSNVFDDLDGDGVVEGEGRNYVVLNGDDKKNTINATSGNPNWIEAGAGNDVINGKNAYDMLAGNEGNDKIDASKATGGVEIYGGADKDTLTGSAHNDWIAGNEGNDSIKGGKGDDTLLGGDHETKKEGSGNDTIYGGDGNDFVYGGDGNDLIKGEKGDDELYGNAGDDKMYGGDGYDYINGGDGNDLIKGEKGESWLVGGAGNDTIEGGSDYDYIQGGADADLIKANNGDDYIEGDEGADTIYGGNGSDTIVASTYLETVPAGVKTVTDYYNHFLADENAKTIDGGKGNDVIWGSAGADTIKGGDGNDKLYVFGENSVTYAGSGDDLINLYAKTNKTLYGEKGNDTISIEYGSATVEGGAGNDSIWGGFVTESDLIFKKGSGHDLYQYRGALKTNTAGDTTVNADTLVFENISTSALAFSQDGDNLVISYGKNDSVTVKDYYKYLGTDDLTYGNNNGSYLVESGKWEIYIQTKDGGKELLSDVLASYENGYIGTSKADDITGTNNSDLIYGYAGNDFILANNGADTIYGGAGNDEIIAFGENSVVYGGDGKDDITLMSRNQKVAYGEKGNDYLSLEYGLATISGGVGNDTIEGGFIDDSDIVFAKGDGKDLYQYRGAMYICDKESGKKLNGDYEVNAETLVFEDSSISDLSFAQKGDNLVITYGKNSSVTVENYYKFLGATEPEQLEFVYRNGNIAHYITGSENWEIYIQTDEGKGLLTDALKADIAAWQTSNGASDAIENVTPDAEQQAINLASVLEDTTAQAFV